MIPRRITSLDELPELLLTHSTQILLIDRSTLLILTTYKDVLVGGDNSNCRLCEKAEKITIPLQYSRLLSIQKFKKMWLSGKDQLLGVRSNNEIVIWGLDPVTEKPFKQSPNVTLLATVDDLHDVLCYANIALCCTGDGHGWWTHLNAVNGFRKSSTGVFKSKPKQLIVVCKLAFVLLSDYKVHYFHAAVNTVKAEPIEELPMVEDIPPIHNIAAGADNLVLLGKHGKIHLLHVADYGTTPSFVQVITSYELPVIPMRIIQDFTGQGFLLICDKKTYVWSEASSGVLMELDTSLEFDSMVEAFGTATCHKLCDPQKKIYDDRTITLVNDYDRSRSNVAASVLREAKYFNDLFDCVTHERRMWNKGPRSCYNLPKEFGPGSVTFVEYVSSGTGALKHLDTTKLMDGLEFGLLVESPEFLIALLESRVCDADIDWIKAYKLACLNQNELLRFAALFHIAETVRIRQILQSDLEQGSFYVRVLEEDCLELGIFI